MHVSWRKLMFEVIYLQISTSDELKVIYYISLTHTLQESKHTQGDKDDIFLLSKLENQYAKRE